MNIQSVLLAIAISATLISGRVSAQSPPAPAAVKNLVAMAGDQQVTLGWDNPNNTSITKYQYRQSTDSGKTWSPDWTNITDSDKNTTSHTVTNLTNGIEYTFEVRAVNATGNGAAVSVRATPVLPPLTVTWPEDIKGTQNSSLWTSLTSNPPQISVSGGRPSYTYEIAKDGAPDGLTIDSSRIDSSGTLTGTPTESGAFEVRVVVRDAASQSVSDTLDITISPPLNISSIAYKTVEKDSMITPIHLSATGGWKPYSYALSGAPMGISLSSDNRITGSPSQDGTFPITLTVTDARGSTGEHSFQMSVYSKDLAEKFSPILILTEHPSIDDRIVLYPEPVEIMSATSVDSLWFDFQGNSGDYVLDISYQDLLSRSPTNHRVLVDQYRIQYPDINFSQSKFASLPGYLQFDNPGYVILDILLLGISAHFEYPGNDKESWNNTYTGSGPKRGAAFPNTAYVHIFDEGGQVVIQYYYFYPFNDFQNKHEGDWQHINVIVDSFDPKMAKLVGIDYKFHGNGLTYTSIGERIFDPQTHFAPAEGGTHPVVYVGAGSHGGYPTGGHYSDPGQPGFPPAGDEDMTTDGIVLSTNVEDTNRDVAQSYDLILLPNPDPGQPNKGLSPEMSWLGTGARWGTRDVSSSGSVETYDESPVGPAHKDSWDTPGASGYPFFKVPYGEFIGDPPEQRRISHNSKRWFQQFPIVQNVTWQDTIKLIGDIVVYPGATLTIDAGTTIMAYPNRDIHGMMDSNRVDIINYGKIIANGTSEQQIVFRSDSSSPASGHWYGIRNHGHLTMSNFTIQHSVVGLDLHGMQTLTNMTLSNNNRNNTTPLTIASIADVTATQNGAITDITVSASGGWAPYTYFTSDLPSGIVFDEKRVLITGTPTAVGDSDITVTVRDAVNDEASTTFNLSVTAAIQPLSIAPIADITATQNMRIDSIQVNASGGQGGYAYAIKSDPEAGAGLSISDSGLITGTPTASKNFKVTVTVENRHDALVDAAFSTIARRSFTMRVRPPVKVSALTVAEINDISVKISAVQTNSPITPIQVSASGGQTPYAYSLSSNPATGSGLTIGSSSGRITGTPTKSGTFTLTVKVTDKAKKTVTDNFSLSVSLIGDFNGDGVVNLSDHSLFVAVFGLSKGDDGFNAEMDLNGDGTINTADFLIFTSHFPNADQFF